MRRWGLLALMISACSGEIGSPQPPITGDGAVDGRPGAIDAPPGPGIDAPAAAQEPPELAGITMLHNQARAQVQTATPLPALVWSPALAATAAAWVAQCVNVDGFPPLIDHNDGRSTGHPYYVGENIFGSSGTATAAGAVNSWMAEKASYNYANNTCAGVCGHYTQVVWRTTLELGCARGSCPGVQYPSTIVCNYGPGGNDGSRPY